jgi:TRAP-type mannitol/chloroaromatic compound transport system substrate-binding protein
LENIVNREAWEKLPNAYKAILEAASARQNIWSLSMFEAKNNEYLNLIKKQPDVEILQFSDETLSALKTATDEVMDELISKDPQAKKIYENYNQFRSGIEAWNAYDVL